jgi:hypothetical protein
MGEIRVLVACSRCARPILLPIAWGLVAYLCVRCRALAAPEPDPPEAA